MQYEKYLKSIAISLERIAKNGIKVEIHTGMAKRGVGESSKDRNTNGPRWNNYWDNIDPDQLESRTQYRDRVCDIQSGDERTDESSGSGRQTLSAREIAMILASERS